MPARQPAPVSNELQELKQLLKASLIFIVLFGVPGIILSRVSQALNPPAHTQEQ